MKVDDVGTTLTFTAKNTKGGIEDVSGATTMEVVIVKPSKTRVTWTLVHKTDGTDGKMVYTTLFGDIESTPGQYRVEGFLVRPANSLRSDIETFEAEDRL